MGDQPRCGPDCQEALREIERLIDGELDPIVRGELVTHLAGCDPCASHADFRRHLKELVARKCTQQEVPEGLPERIRELLHDA
jgi:mycothiol system anti-sigma-R factor